MLRAIALRLARPAKVSTGARVIAPRFTPVSVRSVARYATASTEEGNLEDFFAGHAGPSNPKQVNREYNNASPPSSPSSSSRPTSDKDDRFPTQSSSRTDDSQMSYALMLNRDSTNLPAQSSSSSRTSTTNRTLVSDLDEFFATDILGSDSTAQNPSPSAQHFISAPAQLPANAPLPIASYTMPQESGVAMIRRFMEEHKFLSTKDIWNMGTEGLKPVIRPAHIVNPDGRIKMKRVATMREGRRPWVPPAEPSFPEHPFRSVRFLKTTVLASLEDQGLIHKHSIHVPLETEEEHEAAVWRAESVNRKAERKAARLGLPAPMMRVPATTKEIFGWKLGPGIEVTWVPDEHGIMQRQERRIVSTINPEDPIGPIIPVPENKWEHAERMEYQYHRTKLMEARATAERQIIRRQRYREDREKHKKEVEEDKRSGRWNEVQKEKRRLEALETIEAYARQTGQDVSAWIEELGSGPLDESPRYRPKHLTRGGAIPRGTNPRARSTPIGFPIN